MAVSLGTVFILNSVALLIFPTIGWLLHLSQTQFGLWAALAIHDTSSVVGATAKYGALALAIGTTVKLARALWIVPLSIATAIVKKPKRASSGHGSSSFLPGSGGQHLLTAIRSRVSRTQQARQTRPFRDAFPDRHRAHPPDDSPGRNSSFDAGRNSMGFGRAQFAGADSHELDSYLKRP